MKRYFFFFLFTAITTLAYATGTVKLSGRIHAPVSDSIYITYNNSRLAFDPVEIGILLNRDGTFSTSFKVTEAYTQVSLKHGGMKSDLVVAPGYDLELGAEGKRFDSSIHYKGEGSFVAGFAQQHGMERGLMENYLLPVQQHFGDTLPAFKKFINDLEQKEVQYLNDRMTPLPVDFVQYWVSYYHFFTYFAMLQYPLLHEMAKQKTYFVKKVPPANFAIVYEVPEIFNDSILGIPTYRMYLDQLYKMRLNAAGYSNLPDGDEKQRYRQDDSLLTLYPLHMLPLSMEYAMASLTYSNARTQPIPRTERMLTMLTDRWPKSEYIVPIQRQLAIKQRLAKGEKAMDFAINTPQGATLKLSDLKGKVVLLTFWSGAYEQGAADLSITKQYFNKFSDSAVAFVYVSIDGNDQVWKSTIERYRLSGIHTHVNGWKSMLAELYGIQAVPTFFLIDKQGRFAMDGGEVPLPRQGQALPNKIEELLKE